VNAPDKQRVQSAPCVSRLYYDWQVRHILPRGDGMNERDSKVVKNALLEIKLYINQQLYNKGAITEEMYMKAKERIIKGTPHN
jgi:hypothetical protein